MSFVWAATYPSQYLTSDCLAELIGHHRTQLRHHLSQNIADPCVSKPSMQTHDSNVVFKKSYPLYLYSVLHFSSKTIYIFLLLCFEHVVQERRAGREHGHFHHGSIKERLMEKSVIESGESSGYESSAQVSRSLWRKQGPESPLS